MKRITITEEQLRILTERNLTDNSPNIGIGGTMSLIGIKGVPQIDLDEEKQQKAKCPSGCYCDGGACYRMVLVPNETPKRKKCAGSCTDIKNPGKTVGGCDDDSGCPKEGECCYGHVCMDCDVVPGKRMKEIWPSGSGGHGTGTPGPFSGVGGMPTANPQGTSGGTGKKSKPSTIRRSDRDKARRRPYSSKAMDMRGSRDYGTGNKTIGDTIKEELLKEGFIQDCAGPKPNNCTCTCNPDNGCGTIKVTSSTSECEDHCSGFCGKVDDDTKIKSNTQDITPNDKNPLKRSGNRTKSIKDALREELLNEQGSSSSFQPNFNLNGCPAPVMEGPYPGQYSLSNWWNGSFGNTFTNHPNQCNFLNNKYNAFVNQINQNMSSGPPSCNPLWNNMLFNKLSVLRELSLQIDASAGTSCNHPWT